MQSGPNAVARAVHIGGAVEVAIVTNSIGVRSGRPRRPSPVVARSCPITRCVTCVHICIIA